MIRILKAKTTTMKQDRLGKCHFCEEIKKLIKAHIISRAFFRGKAKEYGGRPLVEVEKDKSGKEVKSNGYFDYNILCYGCDSKFGNYEKILIEFLRDSKNNKYYYKEISIAILSILWKAHITTNQEFKDVDLGKYGDTLYDCLKRLLNGSDLLPLKDFTIWIQRYENDLGNKNNKSDIIFNMINCGSKGRDEYNSTLYRFDFSGHQIIIRVGGNPLPKTINKFITNDEPNIQEIPYSFDGSEEDIDNPNQSMIQALRCVRLS